MAALIIVVVASVVGSIAGLTLVNAESGSVPPGTSRLSGSEVAGVRAVQAQSGVQLVTSDQDDDVRVTAVDLEAGWTVSRADGGVFAGRADQSLAKSIGGVATRGALVEFGHGRPDAVILTAPRIHEMAIRYRSGEGWGPWSVVSAPTHEGPDGLRQGTEGHEKVDPTIGPLWLGGRVDAIEVVDLVAGPGSLRTLDLIALGVAESKVRDASADWSSTRNRNDTGQVLPASLPLDASASAAAAPSLGSQAGRPPIKKRSEWAAAGWEHKNTDCEDGPEKASNVEALVLHHTVSNNSYSISEVDDMLRSIYYLHVVINGWCDVGYNFLVDRFGQIWEGRTGSLGAPVIGGHARGFNTSTVGVALLGQHQPGASPSGQPPSAEASKAVADLAAWRLGLYGVDPAGYTWLRNRSSGSGLKLEGEAWHYLPTVLAHRDLGFTGCPGDHGYSVVQSLPDVLVPRRDSRLPYRFPLREPAAHGPGFVVAEAPGGLRPAGAGLDHAIPGAPSSVGQTSVIAVDGNYSGGYQLTAAGTLVSFGQAPTASPNGRWPSAEAEPADIVVNSEVSGGWVLDSVGSITNYGNAPAVEGVTTGSAAVAFTLNDSGSGYVVDRNGRLYPVGGAPNLDFAPSLGGVAVVDIAIAGFDGGGRAGIDDQSAAEDGSIVGNAFGVGWVVDANGKLHGLGGAQTAKVSSSAAVVAVGVADNEPGGWVLDSDGQLWPFLGARRIRPVSTNVTDSNIVDGAQLGYLLSPDFFDSDDARYAAALFELFMGRRPSSIELSRQVSKLEDGAERLELTDPMARSQGWAGASIDVMYRDVLGRKGDDAGRKYWLDQVASGMRFEQLGVYFYGSPEYAAAAGSNRAYVSKLYEVLLHRTPDADGLDYWTIRLDDRRARPDDVAHGFYVSPESRRDRTDRLFRRILGRAPTKVERDEWIEKLIELDDVALAAELAATDEFYDRAAEG